MVTLGCGVLFAVGPNDYLGFRDQRLIYTRADMMIHWYNHDEVYPVKHWVDRGGPQDFKYAVLRSVYPHIDFARVPFPYQDRPVVCFAFKSDADLKEVFGES